jgi:hypothetical protein
MRKMGDSMTNPTDIGSSLLESIKSKDAQQSVSQVQQFKENMRNVTVGADYVMWITEPANLTRVHKALAEDLNVPPRLLAIRRAPMNRTQKAVLLIQAIEMAVKKVHSV